MVKSITKIFYIFFVLIATFVFSKTTKALEVPTLVSAEVKNENGKNVVYIQWKQSDAKDYGYVVTKQINNGEELTILELEPASSGNINLSSGGTIRDSGIEDGKNYIYYVYPYNRNSEQLGDDYSPGTKTSLIEKVKAAGSGRDRPRLEVPVNAKPPVTPPPSSSPPPSKCTAKVNTEFGWVCDITDYINKILGWIVGFIGSLAVLMIIYAGYIYMTSQGNPERIGVAKEIIIGVITGVVLLFTIGIILRTIGIL